MFKQRPFKFSLLVLAVLIVLYSTAYNFAFYWSYPQFDFLLHTLSGLWISLVILGLALYFGTFVSLKDYKIKSFLISFVTATLIGVIWALLENFYQLTDVAAPDYSFVTALHIFTNALGGSLAHFYFVKRKKSKEPVVNFSYPFAE